MNPPPIDEAISIALEHHRAGRLAEAEAIYRRVLDQAPDHPEALHLLGVLAGQTGRLPEAIELIGRAIAVAPASGLLLNSLGECYRRAGEHEAALECFRGAIEREPFLALAQGNFASALHALGRREEAVAAYERAIALEPRDFTVLSNLGVALQELDRTAPAIAAYRRALELNPFYPIAQRNLGVAFHHLANALRQEGRLDDAIAAYQQAIALVPDHAHAHNNLGGIYKEQGRLDLARECLRRAVECKPDFVQAASNRLFDLHFDPDSTAQSILAEHRAWARTYAAPLAAQIAPHANDRTPDRRLRVGFVSPDFRSHPVGQLLLPLFTHHDRGRAAFVAYSDVRESDALTARLEAQSDLWRPTIALNDQDLAEQIRGDRIDVLVDLSLHTANNRMLVFARKPAPVQVTMLGLPSTTGLDTIDYRLTDPHLDPPGAGDAAYTERSIRLPHCFWCYHPATETAPAGALPAATNGHITFGCLNQFAKVTRPALDLWVRILASLPAARLRLHAPAGSHRDAVRSHFQQAGVTAERIEFVARLPFPEYLASYRTLDLCLDPFPFCGGTTTMDALWMGVPVITLAGRTAVGRGGVSILANLGLTEWIAATPAEYQALAIALATDRDRLARLRAGLRERMQSSPLMDGPQYAADVETALLAMWNTWCGR